MKKSYIVSLVIFLLILIGAVTFLVWGGVTHEEPGFTHPERSWAHVPLTVGCKGYVEAEDDACSAADEIVSRINTRVGFELLAWSPLIVTPDISIMMRAPVEVGTDEPGGHFLLRHSGDVYVHCDLRTMNVSGGASDLEQLVLYHEMGHCIGLDHDDDERSGPLTVNSIMRPVQTQTADRTIPHWFSDYDKSIIWDKYGPEAH